MSPLPGSTVVFRLYGPDDRTGATASSRRSVARSAAGVRDVARRSRRQPPACIAGARTTAATPTTLRSTAPCNGAEREHAVARRRRRSPRTASADIALGGQLTDTATVGGRVNPLRGFDDGLLRSMGRMMRRAPARRCSRPARSPSGRRRPGDVGGVHADGGRHLSLAREVQRRRQQRRRHRACNAADENVVVTQTTPTIATQASADVLLGAGPFSDTATCPVVSTRWRVRRSCSGCTARMTRLHGRDGVQSHGRRIRSPVARRPRRRSRRRRPGTYRWRATYSGDANNAGGYRRRATRPTRTSWWLRPRRRSPRRVPDIIARRGQITDTATSPVGQPVGGFDDRVPPVRPGRRELHRRAGLHVPPVDYPVAGGPVTSAAFTPTAAGPIAGARRTAATPTTRRSAGRATRTTRTSPSIARADDHDERLR